MSREQFTSSSFDSDELNSIFIIESIRTPFLAKSKERGTPGRRENFRGTHIAPKAGACGCINVAMWHYVKPIQRSCPCSHLQVPVNAEKRVICGAAWWFDRVLEVGVVKKHACSAYMVVPI
jgi:hypothetical protein